MPEPVSRWQTAELSRTYLEGVRAAIPAAALQLDIIVKIAQEWQPAARRVLDLGCGGGIVGRTLLAALPQAEACFADFSEPMLAAARAKLGGEARATLVRADFGAPAWREAVAAYAPFDIVVSGFAIHHQPDNRKRALYAEIYSLLAEGGLFLNLEHVSSATRRVEALGDSLFVDYLLAHHRQSTPNVTRESVAQTFYTRPDKAENILAPLDVQCAWLREIGYADVDCYFRIFELALFGGRKPGG
jgi:tRNA (cmo5U34)-methyltransferase